MINLGIPIKYRKPLIWLAAIAGLMIILNLTIMAPLSIQSTNVIKRDLVAQVYGNGTVEAKVVVPVSSKVTGRIEMLFADQGDTVKSEQILAQLEAEDYRQQVLEADAGVKKAEAVLVVGNADNQKAQANLELAEKNYARIKAMGDKNLISQQAVDEQAALLAVAQKEVERSAAAIDVAGKDQQASLANLSFAETRKNDMIVAAPVDGIVISRNLEKGATVAPGLPIFRIADPSLVWVTAFIDESQCRDLALGQPAAIYLRSSPKKMFKGHVARIGLESDRVTEELEVDVAFDPPLPPFRIGEQAEAYITTVTKKDVTALPAGVVVSKGKQRNVWIIKDGKLKTTDIVAGIEDRTGFVEVVSGIDDKSSVALAPSPIMATFKDGMRVKVKK